MSTDRKVAGMREAKSCSMIWLPRCLMATASRKACRRAASGSGAAAEYSHAEYVKEYKGTRTCLKCHREDAESFFHSQQGDQKSIDPSS